MKMSLPSEAGNICLLEVIPDFKFFPKNKKAHGTEYMDSVFIKYKPA